MNATHHRWERTEESEDYFLDEDRLRVWFWFAAAAGVVLVAALAAGLWRLRLVARVPPPVVGIAQGVVFSAPPAGIASLRDRDFDQQFAETVEVLFGRTEKGLPPAIRDFCAPEVVAALDGAYHDAKSQYPAGFVQTMTLLEAKTITSAPGLRRVYYRGLLSSRSLVSAQTSSVYLDCTFALAGSAPLNSSGWRLVKVLTLVRDDFYRDETEKAEREALGLAPR